LRQIPDIVVSIINYRTGAMTIACVESVLAALDGVEGRVVVVDNASGDGSADDIAAWIERAGEGDRVTLMRSPANTGFSGGHNLGMGHGPARYYLVLNSDGYLRPDFLRAILKTADARPEMGLFAPRIEHKDGEAQVSLFRFASPLSELIRAANSGPILKLLRRREVALPLDPDEAAIEWASFACILLRAEMVAEIGPMDEGYFLYFEDAEYCLRARRAGWRIAHVPEAKMVHLRGGSGPVKALQKAKRRLPGYLYASRSRFFFQAYGRGGLILANALWHLGRGLAQTRRLVGRRVPPAHEGEARDLWINAFNPTGPRLAPHEIDGNT
jgi:N-acetylglucosaminyl-diphospho-decaprenol L-rhamnosyltransferase